MNTQFETNPGASTTKDNMTGLMKTLREQTQVLEDILTTSRQYIGGFRDFSEKINQQVARGGLPTDIPYNDTTFEKHVNTDREGIFLKSGDETEAIRAVVDTTVRARRDHFKKLWTDFQAKTAQGGPRPQAIDFNAHTAQLVVTKGQGAGSMDEESISVDVRMQTRKEKGKRGDRRKKHEKTRRRDNKGKKHTREHRTGTATTKSQSSSSSGEKQISGKRSGDSTSHSSSSPSTGSSVKSLDTAIKNIEKRKEKAAKQREQIEHTGEALEHASREYATRSKHRAQTLNNNMGAVMPKLQQLLSQSSEGEKHLQEVNLVWGEINTHTP